MDAFSAFSTAPSVNTGVFNGIHRLDGNNSAAAVVPPPGHQLGGMPTSGNVTAPSSMLHPSAAGQVPAASGGMLPFSTATSAVPMAGHPFSVGTTLGTLHFSTAIETDNFDGDSISHTLSLLQHIAEGRHMVSWAEMMDAEHPAESAARIATALGKTPAAGRPDAYMALARHIVTPKHLTIVSALEEQYRNAVRDCVLQELLQQLTAAGSDPMPVCAEMLAELSRLNLVRLSGVAAAVEQFLTEPDQRRAGFAVLGRVAEQTRGSEAFLRAIQNTNNKRVEQMLCALYKEPQYEYDAVAITRLLGGEAAERSSTALRQHTTLVHGSGAPVTCLQYFRGRDELVSGHGCGSIVMWDGPSAQGDVAPRGTVDLPSNGIPIGMAAPLRGQYLAVASMPCTASHPYAPHVEARKQKQKSPVASGPPVPSIRILDCSDPLGQWARGEVINRPAECTLTAVAALSNSTVCSAESLAGKDHTLQLFNATNGEHIRSLTAAHTDYTTVLTTCEDNEQIFCSGSRDGCVKLWDTRASNNNNASVATSLDMPNVKDAITTIHAFRSFLFVGSMDGSMLIWDTRKISAPVARRSFISPVLDITEFERGQTAVATARGLYLISLETMGALDVLPNVAYTHLRSNESGNVLFAAGSEGISVFSLKS